MLTKSPSHILLKQHSYLTGSYQASCVITLSIITSNTAGQSKKMIVSGMFWFGACIGNIASPFFYKADQAPSYHLGIASLLVANVVELGIFVALRFAYKRENRMKVRQREEELLVVGGRDRDVALNETAFLDITDKENPNFEYVY